jgi:NAD+ synthase (glutamine-hydrolysing)
MKIAIAQINPTVGALENNALKIVDYINQAKEKGADLVVFPELAITGYPPEDLLLKPQFIEDNLLALQTVIKATKNIAVYVGFVDKLKEDLFNAGAFIVNGKLVKTYHKMNLPNYSVFDEKRYFKEGKKPETVILNKIKLGLGICEDIWVEGGPYKAEAKLGAKIILNINASPYHMGKLSERESILKKRAIATKTHVVYVNLVGGQDELVFDGGSMIVSSKGKVIARAPMFKEALIVTDEKGGETADKLDDMAEVYEALVTGVRDYVQKNGFKEVVIGLSGGIDSALTAAIAADAIGKDKVHTVFMPSQYSAQQSKDDSKALVKNLGIFLDIIPISEILEMYLSDITKYFRGKPEDITEENMQARIRAVILMAMSNKHGWLLLSTGNKSETSTGYCTLYGDMAGGFNALKDVPKTLVYRLAKWKNLNGEVIPQPIIDRAPTAELRPDQKDQDTLPPYDVLDKIITAYVEENKSAKQISAMGIDKDVVNKTIRMIDHSEYKRRQSAPGPRITPRAFGKDWRVPITNGYKL